ncbi:ORF6 protein [Simian hemorrhagic encephalitis virus]|uniref:ORF6 protein n=1 Tax=Simian hemorrhagic encephalitis virus TaxID=1965068 RepID=A0A0F6PS73_9NIDO|nr:ORF6 protein [Simian hemorrhagic encephalitis virus]AKC89299.1 ORF6 protein [Simian hemorrhagic encephalitis virus]
MHFQWFILLLQTTLQLAIATSTPSPSPSTPNFTGGSGGDTRHAVCVPCSGTSLHNQTGLSFSRNESVFSGGCATHIYAGVSKFSERLEASTNAFSVLHLLECITESLTVNGTFFCRNNSQAVPCSETNLTVIAFCHNHSTYHLVDSPHPLAAIEWAAAIYSAITLTGTIILLNV